MAHIEGFKRWAESIRQDTDAHRALLESGTADEHARKLAAAALLYMVSKMDLIPDWNEGIGVIDDVMVLRVCAQLTRGHARGPLPTAAEVSLDRMASEADAISAFLGAAIYDKLKVYCARLSEQAVRGRTPQLLIEDVGQRAALFQELDEELLDTVPIMIEDPVDAELRLKAYLTHKLQ